jgi:hypothetical protein
MRSAILRRQPALLTYGITPPKSSYDPDRRRAIAERQAARISALPVDGLIVYDIQDESARTSAPRPFPFLQTLDPVEYAFDDLAGVAVPKVVYRCVAPLDEVALEHSLRRIHDAGGLTVLVGAASGRQEPRLRLSDAYRSRHSKFPELPVGGVLIPERHERNHAEDARVFQKVDAGCSFFVTQAVYAVEASKNVLSDLYYRSQVLGRELPPVLVTLSPCGSLKTLAFMRWLGIDVPRWLENELSHAQDILQMSIERCTDILAELVEYAAAKRIPLGCNIESVSLHKSEIEASVELTQRARAILDRGFGSPDSVAPPEPPRSRE